ncbi:serpin family protein [Streptomyces sp. NBC_00572]|uniref:serpin family protein n=1 Tax=Streptomyces sp. NBC_00572 TaxID=2903664 RepID=UPI002250C779|nr:serpin family protein [Streptomyces sp. NBC_00572]MCX4980639.1 serpin family protein [Streptomyces sp. NBC_00572]
MTPGPTAFEADVVQALAVRWLPLLGDDDFVCSPAGLWLALGAVASGARGRTAEELRELLGADGGAAAEAVTGAGRRLGATEGVALATGVWSTMPVLDAFRRGLPDVRFGVLPGAAWFALPDEVFGATDGMSLGEIPDAQDELDAWVRESTGGRIQRLPLRLDGSEDLVLVNALALKGSWLAAFPAHLTHDEPFTDGYGDTRPVPTMRQRIPAAWVWYVGGVAVVELPCEGDAGARVRFLLGPEGAGPAEVLPAAWAGPGAREGLVADSAELLLPRFTLRTRADVHDHLPALGVRRALSRDEADFLGLSAADLFLSKVVQEAMVEVAEEGVEAAAVTAVTMTRGAAPLHHKVVERIAFDRPFGVAVMDTTGEVPLFTGWRQSAPTT